MYICMAYSSIFWYIIQQHVASIPIAKRYKVKKAFQISNTGVTAKDKTLRTTKVKDKNSSLPYNSLEFCWRNNQHVVILLTSQSIPAHAFTSARVLSRYECCLAWRENPFDVIFNQRTRMIAILFLYSRHTKICVAWLCLRMIEIMW